MKLDQISKLVDSELAQASAKSLRADGPLIDVALHFDCGDGRPCEPVYGKALVDTGADRTAIEFSEADKLGALQQGSYHAQGVTSEAITLPVYPLTMTFPGTDLPAVKVERAAGTPHLKSQGIVALIGRDVLEQAHLTYDGPKGQFVLRAPRGKLTVKSPAVAYGTMALLAAVGGLIAYNVLKAPECQTKGAPT